MHAFCRSFDKGDPRIEATLRAIEAAIQLRLDHYVPRTLKPKKLAGDRVNFVSENLLPGGASKSLATLCTADDGEFVQVTISNVGGPFNGYARDSYAGHVFVMAGTAIQGLVLHLGNVVGVSEAFHAFADGDEFSRQQAFTVQVLQERRLALEKQRNELGRDYLVNVQFLDNLAAQYTYSLKVLPLKGVAPHGKEFDMRLHWINYLSQETARRFVFPDEAIDAPLHGLYSPCGNGWLLKISHDEPDLRNPELQRHIERIYRRLADACR